MSVDKLLTPPQVARRLQVNERTVTQWLRRGHLRGFKIGKEWRVSTRDLEDFLEQNANVPAGAKRNSA
ncbi:MAG: helix-turn-helix domain-containing protein [Proteobacteria bacterium]|nr:helix-turn-helix domain-containing protein [Pseudomonadota bacterium]